jgi:hypothetical protein
MFRTHNRWPVDPFARKVMSKQERKFVIYTTVKEVENMLKLIADMLKALLCTELLLEDYVDVINLK